MMIKVQNLNSVITEHLKLLIVMLVCCFLCMLSLHNKRHLSILRQFCMLYSVTRFACMSLLSILLAMLLLKKVKGMDFDS